METPHKIVLSFDIGIKNLSYCTIEIHDNNNFKILEWKNINL